MTRTPQPAAQQDAESWQAGYHAGYAGQPPDPPPPGVNDRLSYYSGWIEGKAERRIIDRAGKCARFGTINERRPARR